MKRSTAYVAVAAAVVLSCGVLTQDPGFCKVLADEIPPCDQCACAEVTGFVSTRSVMGTYEWYTGRWFYYRNPDGTSGAPTKQSALELFHEGVLDDCVITQNTYATGQTINEYDVPVPDPECCLVEEALTGRSTLLYGAGPSPPGGVDPSPWTETKCQSGE